LPPVYSVEMCVALLGNIMALWILVTKERRTWHMGMVFSCNLVISDIFYALSLPLLIGYYSRKRIWKYGDVVCKIERFLFSCNLYASIYLIMCISVHRYLAIVHPFFTRKHILPKHAKIISVFVWIFMASISSPNLYYTGVNMYRCTLFANPFNNSILYIYRMFMAVIGCLVPFIVTFASYVGVISAVFKNKKITTLQKKKVALIVGLGCVLYAVSFVPYHILQIWKAKLTKEDTTNCYMLNAYQISKALACMNMCLHPILYMAVFDSIRAIFGELEQTWQPCELCRQQSERHRTMAVNMSSSGSCNSSFTKELLPPIYGVEMCVALMGNILALYLIVTKERKNWHTGVVFSCNLVISDILYALTLPLLIVYYWKGRIWGFGNAMCKIERFLFTCNLYVSIYFIMCISVNRYLAIVHPFFTRNHIRPKHAKIISLLVWILVAGLSSPILYYSGVKKN
ncbi:P2Y purinoceptor 11, partial [Silurus meridionalis]